MKAQSFTMIFLYCLGPKEQKPQVADSQGAMIGPGGVRRRQGRSHIQRNIER